MNALSLSAAPENLDYVALRYGSERSSFEKHHRCFSFLLAQEPFLTPLRSLREHLPLQGEEIYFAVFAR